MKTELEDRQETNLAELSKIEAQDSLLTEAIPDVVTALTDVQEGMPVTDLDSRKATALPSKRGGSHVGPASYRQLSDMMHSVEAIKENIKDATFVNGIQTLVRNDVLADMSLYTFGEFCIKVEELALTDEDAFIEVLCAFCDDAVYLLDREQVVPDPKAPEKTLTIINAVRRRLAHALYHSVPEWLTAPSGETPKGEKRIENAVGKYRRVEREAAIVARKEIDAVMATQYPDVPQEPEEAPTEAKKARISSAASKYWIEAYRIADVDTRTFLINSAIAYGFDRETIHKWRSKAMEGLDAKTLAAQAAKKQEEKQN